MRNTIARRFAQATGTLTILACSLAAAACIQKETRSVMYLDPSGAVTWSITESDVHSDGETPAERAKEEAEYREQMMAVPSPLVTLLESMGGYAVARTVLKDQPPFEVHTIARFDRIDVLFERACAASGYLCVSRLETTGDRTTLTVEVLGELDAASKESNPIDGLLDQLAIVCVNGRFVEASGFKLDGDRKASIADTDGQDNDQLVLTLTWQR